MAYLLLLDCGNTISNYGASTPIGDCNMICNGNSSEYCGGPNRLNMYTTKSAPTAWTALGCYTDSVAARTLTTAEYPGTMTVELCTSACKSAGYIYAGVEYGGECYCGNSFSNGGGPAPDGSAGCNMACAGNAQETCGGSNRLNVFQYGGGSSTTTTPASSAAASTSTSVGTGSATGLPKGWAYQGCYIDGANGRIMNTQEPDSNSNTIEVCVNTCVGLGYSVAGMEYGVQCFCDNFIRNGASLTADTDCNMACAGNSAEKCGAGNRMSIYSNATLQVYQPPAPQKTGLNGSWVYQGCLLDNAEQRTFPYQLILPNNNTANNCLQSCQAFGYGAGGMEYADECCKFFKGDLKLATTNNIQTVVMLLILPLLVLPLCLSLTATLSAPEMHPTSVVAVTEFRTTNGLEHHLIAGLSLRVTPPANTSS
jgi:WSC domain